MPEPTPDQLEALLEVQETDHRIRRLRHRLDDLEEQRELARLEQRREELDDELVRVGEQLAACEDEQARAEREIRQLRERRDAERARLYDGTVTNQREMHSLEAEIESVERRIGEHEDVELEAMERQEALEAERDRIQQERAELDTAHEQTRAARDESAQGLLAELGELQAVRDQQVISVPADLLARYDETAERLGGTGVGRLEGTSCTACRIAMSHADVNDLLAGPSLTTCPQCRRLLVIPE